MSHFSPAAATPSAATAAYPAASVRPFTAPPAPAPADRGQDSVDLSGAARALNRLESGPEVRSDLVARLRDEIAAGTYQTADKLDATVARLAERLG